MKLANDDDIDPKLRAKLRKKFSSMMSSLFKEEGASLRIEILSEPEVTSFIDTHSSVLNGAISKSKMSDKMRGRMEESNWIFSG
ncbi:MAG TPA: phage head morphogenesis protein, partial [Bacteroidales bacterium]|nr:phage head morphogenesis protein [Bacteroidales bacterium]